ncbi:MAG: CBS domain-containing protein [Deltaproteobacteria bacterium]|nr:CBS domain-containing protein [Deltaproteobacteria bacterium]MBW2384343.1 CBS domain-containing protein [Deltaproteobacteria bacterium]
MSNEPGLVRDLMTEEVATLNWNDKLSIADDVMKLGRIRHMPVVDDDKCLVGILSQRDLLHGALSHALGFGQVAKQKVMATILVREVMGGSPTTIRPDAPLEQAAAAMVAEKIGCLPVLDEGRLVGILTEGDFVALHAKGT